MPGSVKLCSFKFFDKRYKDQKIYFLKYFIKILCIREKLSSEALTCGNSNFEFYKSTERIQYPVFISTFL